MPVDQFVTLIDEEIKKADEKIKAGMPAPATTSRWFSTRA